jgi:hypothetical protein
MSIKSACAEGVAEAFYTFGAVETYVFGVSALKAITSSRIIHPPGPVPLTAAISIPLSIASLHALGLANTRSLKESLVGAETPEAAFLSFLTSSTGAATAFLAGAATAPGM